MSRRSAHSNGAVRIQNGLGYSERESKMRKQILGFTLILVSITAAYAENWPQWRGPNLNGLSNEKNLPMKWTTEENVTWKVAMPGWSGSTPVIWKDRVFLNVADGNDL